MADIVLTTLNARYLHASFGLRYLMANLPADLKPRAAMLEFDTSPRPVDVLEQILAHQPKIVGVGVYIWNALESARLAADLKRVQPGIRIVLGGPEVSYETEQQAIVADADFVITGEADLAFGQLCERILNGRQPMQKIIRADLPEFAEVAASKARELELPSLLVNSTTPARIAMPYDLYNEDDLAHRVVYVEASRGCPFKCEFCLSSLDVPVRNVPIDAFLKSMQHLLDRGLRQFKFVDRTFNLNLQISQSILRFFLDRYVPGLFLHFEMIPDRLPDALRATIAKFPPGALQFEVGVQTFSDDVSARISRRQDNAKLGDNLRFLREQTGVHVHADLIVGLPGESVASFAAGFDRLVAMQPQEIQVGMLKRLRGTPIIRHDAEFAMVYSPNPPYEILQNRDIDFPTMQRMRRFSRYWDLIANSGNFIETTPLIWAGGASPFARFLSLSDWLFGRAGRKHGIALRELVDLLFEFLTTEGGLNPAEVAPAIWRDYQRGGRSDLPACLRPYVQPADTRIIRKGSTGSSGGGPARQARHIAVSTCVQIPPTNEAARGDPGRLS